MTNTELISQLRHYARVDSIVGDDVRKKDTEKAADALEALEAEVKRLKGVVNLKVVLAAAQQSPDTTAIDYMTAYSDGLEQGRLEQAQPERAPKLNYFLIQRYAMAYKLDYHWLCAMVNEAIKQGGQQ